MYTKVNQKATMKDGWMDGWMMAKHGEKIIIIIFSLGSNCLPNHGG
jgi:hypothetical protein